MKNHQKCKDRYHRKLPQTHTTGIMKFTKKCKRPISPNIAKSHRAVSQKNHQNANDRYHENHQKCKGPVRITENCQKHKYQVQWLYAKTCRTRDRDLGSKLQRYSVKQLCIWHSFSLTCLRAFSVNVSREESSLRSLLTSLRWRWLIKKSRHSEKVFTITSHSDEELLARSE